MIINFLSYSFAESYDKLTVFISIQSVIELVFSKIKYTTNTIF